MNKEKPIGEFKAIRSPPLRRRAKLQRAAPILQIYLENERFALDSPTQSFLDVAHLFLPSLAYGDVGERAMIYMFALGVHSRRTFCVAGEVVVIGLLWILLYVS